MKNNYDLVIIGGGIMGLMTAYYASATAQKILVIEKGELFNKQSASNGLTRSIRQDYLDPFYTNLAVESRKLWLEIEKQIGEKIIIDSGCLNLAVENFTPNIFNSYAKLAYQNLQKCDIDSEEFNSEQLNLRFPQFRADYASLDTDAGFIYIPPLKKFLLNFCKSGKVDLRENSLVKKISPSGEGYRISTADGDFSTDKVVLATGRWINDSLKIIDGNDIRLPIFLDKPRECFYFIPKQRSKFTSQNFPVFACLDVGIYGHPIYSKETLGVKIGFFQPPDWSNKSKIKGVRDFVKKCIPELVDAEVIPVNDYDQCYYTMVEDDEFILGELPGFQNIFVASGWRGTGFKFAPLIGETISDLCYGLRPKTDIARFTLKRFN